jgi:hypothetical protein
VDLAHEVAEDQRITSGVDQFRAECGPVGECRDELTVGVECPVKTRDGRFVGAEQILLSAADLALTPVGLFGQVTLLEAGRDCCVDR